jgi:hypothetical protein
MTTKKPNPQPAQNPRKVSGTKRPGNAKQIQPDTRPGSDKSVVGNRPGSSRESA